MIFLNICLCKLALEFWKKWEGHTLSYSHWLPFLGNVCIVWLIATELLLQFERKKSNKVYIF